ncbi:hypothetical protein C8035_v010432 [Colletotrichum spinosum]|uniref:Uncharacterized protein n=1 Tax=Colletotrichum spinosum TaxID=1347390 RepID=A0A4R8PNY5_9PEZI|nr:hypothetical protein C8035_v010432 [Colletotrichum spinosum]
MQPLAFILTAVFASTNVLQGCLGKNEGKTAFVNGQSIYLQARSDCSVSVGNTGYNTGVVGFNAHYDGPC